MVATRRAPPNIARVKFPGHSPLNLYQTIIPVHIQLRQPWLKRNVSADILFCPFSYALF